MTLVPHFVAGRRVEGGSGRTQDVYNPVQGTVSAQVPLATAEEVS
ncbi:hypothetical protein PGAAJM_03410 [Kocuria varians]